MLLNFVNTLQYIYCAKSKLDCVIAHTSHHSCVFSVCTEVGFVNWAVYSLYRDSVRSCSDGVIAAVSWYPSRYRNKMNPAVLQRIP